MATPDSKEELGAVNLNRMIISGRSHEPGGLRIEALSRRGSNQGAVGRYHSAMHALCEIVRVADRSERSNHARMTREKNYQLCGTVNHSRRATKLKIHHANIRLFPVHCYTGIERAITQSVIQQRPLVCDGRCPEGASEPKKEMSLAG